MTKELAKRKDDAPGGAVAAGQFDRRDKIPAEVNAVGKFLQRRVLAAKRDQSEGGCARLVIRHTVNGRVADRVDQAKIEDPGQVTEEAVAKLALEIYDCAYNDAENRGKGTEQKYHLQWYCEGAPNEEPYVFPFTVKPGRTIDRDGGQYVDSYPATEQGVASLLIRRLDHIDDKFLDYIEAMVAPLTAMKTMLDTSVADNAQLRKEIRESAKAVDEAKHAAWERQEESLTRQANREVLREATSGLKMLVPAIAKRVGLIDKTQPIPADSAHIVALVNSLAERGGLDKVLASDLLTNEEKFHIVSEVQAHLESVDLKPAATAEKPSNGNNGKAPVPTSVPPVMTPEQLAAARAREIELAEAQAEAWRVKAEALKATVPAVAASAPVAESASA